MVDIYNVLIGFCLMILGILFLIPNIKEKFQGKSDKYGAYSKIIFGAVGLLIVGLAMIIRELF